MSVFKRKSKVLNLGFSPFLLKLFVLSPFSRSSTDDFSSKLI